MYNNPEKKSQTEQLDIQQKKERILKGEEPIPQNYPYILPDYKLHYLHIGTEKQLFLDNYILDQFYDIKRVPEKPAKHPEPVMTPGDLPWEKYPNPVCKVIYDEKDGILKMWYIQSLEGDPFNMDQALCYAESKDGVNWVKHFDKGCIPYNGITETNIVCLDCSGPMVFRNPDMTDEKKRFFLLYNAYREGKSKGIQRGFLNKLAYSRNGYIWESIKEESDMVLTHSPYIFYDPAIKKYVGYGQHSHHWDWTNRRRQTSRQESADLIHWSPREVVMTATDNGNIDPDIEIFEISPYKVDSLYLGFTGYGRTKPVWMSRGGNNWRDVFYPTNYSLSTSRDGRKWNLVGDIDHPWLENGIPGSMDYGMTGGATPPIVYNGKLMIYYLSIPFTQGIISGAEKNMVPKSALTEEFLRENFDYSCWKSQEGANPNKKNLKNSVGLFTLREDGYMSLRPKLDEGAVLTTQFVFEGNRLYLNADARYGWVKVEVLDDMMEPIEGFSKNDCDPIYGDSSAFEVKWKGNPDVSSLWNRPVRLKIYLREAFLYSFKFGYV